MRITAFLPILAASLLASLSPVLAGPIDDAAPIDFNVGSGTTRDNGWYNLSSSTKDKVVDGVTHTIAGNTGYPGFFGSTGAWPSPIAAQISEGGSTANLQKVANGVAGGPFPSGDSLYYGSFGTEPNTDGGTVGVFESNPVAGLQSLVFQIEIGEAWTYDLFTQPLLTLNFASSPSITLEATSYELLAQIYNGTVEMPSGMEDIYINLHGYQWDLTGYDDITSFDISFAAVEHAQLYALRLHQSDEYSQVIGAVPEPSALTLGLCGIAFFVLTRRRRTARLAIG